MPAFGPKQTKVNFSPATVCPLMTASSTDRRNTGVKSLCWGFKLQGLAGAFVELAVISGH